MRKESQESTLNEFTGFTAETFDFYGENSEGTNVETENLLEVVKNDNPIAPTSKEEKEEVVNTEEIFNWGKNKEDDDDLEEEEEEELEVVNTTTAKKEIGRAHV